MNKTTIATILIVTICFICLVCTGVLALLVRGGLQVSQVARGGNNNGPLVTEERKVGAFTSLYFATPGQLIIKSGTTNALTVEAEQGMLNEISANVRGDQLRIEFRNPLSMMGINPLQSIVYTLTVPQLSSVEIAGSGDVTGYLGGKAIKLTTSGSGNFFLELDASSVDASVLGSGSISLSGAVSTSQVVKIAGSGSYDAPKVSSERADISILGSGSAVVDARDLLTARILGSGDVLYMTKPAKIDQTVIGSGTIRQK